MQWIWNSQNNLEKNNVGELAPPDFKISYKLESSRQYGTKKKKENINEKINKSINL